MAKLMLLGGSQCQLAAARAVKAMGHTLVLADYLANPPAAPLCDRHVRVSTFDVRGCIRAAREARVEGVFTVGTDQPVYTAACVARVLGLPTPISAATALKATNKRAMKAAFERFQVPSAPYACLRRGQGAEALRGLGAPLVLKPSDSQGQRGVFKVASPQEAVSRLDETLAFSRMTVALVEAFYPSEEVTFSGYLHGGRLYPLLLTDRQHVRDALHIGVCAAHRYPSVHAALAPEINRICGRVAIALGATEGPLYVQLLIGARGVLVNEAACRIGGAFEDVTIPFATGFDILGAVIRAALGEPLPSPPEAIAGQTAGLQMSVQMLFCKPGTVAAVTPAEQLCRLPGVLSAGYNYGVGDTLPALENATMRFGHCVLASNAGDMDALVRALYGQARVTGAQGEPLLLSRTYDGGELP